MPKLYVLRFWPSSSHGREEPQYLDSRVMMYIQCGYTKSIHSPFLT